MQPHKGDANRRQAGGRAGRHCYSSHYFRHCEEDATIFVVFDAAI